MRLWVECPIWIELSKELRDPGDPSIVDIGISRNYPQGVPSSVLRDLSAAALYSILHIQPRFTAICTRYMRCEVRNVAILVLFTFLPFKTYLVAPGINGAPLKIRSFLPARPMTYERRTGSRTE